MRLLRKSKPFWNVLSKYGIFSCILRVPITFPPEKLRGVLLSAMCVPDLRGTQGMFSLLHDPRSRRGREDWRRGPSRHPRGRHHPRAILVGPQNPLLKEPEDLKLPFSVTIKDQDHAVLKIDGAKYDLAKGRVHGLDSGPLPRSRPA